MTDYDETGPGQGEYISARSRASVRETRGDVWWFFLLRGVLALALGLFALFWPTLSLSLLALAVGVYFTADGVAGLVAALRASEGRGYLVQALVSIAIGVALVFWPEGSLRVLFVAFGAWILVLGASQLLAARQLPPGDPERTVLVPTGVVAAIAGLALVLWPGGGIVFITWVVALAALPVGAFLVFLALRFRRLGRPVRRV